LTGLTRKEVKNVIDRALSKGDRQKTYSRPARVLTGWFSDPKFQGPYGIPLELRYEGSELEEPSFTELVRLYSGDMAPRQMLNQLLESGAVVEVEGRLKAVSRTYRHSKLSPELIERLGSVGYRVFSSAARNIDKDSERHGHFDRMVFADDGCTEDVLELFDKYIREKGQSFLEDLDVWFTSRKELNDTGEDRKGTGVYMVHYVEDAEDMTSLQDLLGRRGVGDE